MVNGGVFIAGVNDGVFLDGTEQKTNATDADTGDDADTYKKDWDFKRSLKRTVLLFFISEAMVGIGVLVYHYLERETKQIKQKVTLGATLFHSFETNLRGLVFSGHTRP